MADEADVASEQELQAIQSALFVQQNSRIKLLPKGTCHYCDDVLDTTGKLFCNTDCGADYEREQMLKKRLGQSVI